MTNQNIPNISDYFVEGSSYPYSDFDDTNAQKFFLNDFFHYNTDNFDKNGGVTKVGFSNRLDLNTTYSHNSHGYRSKEFHSKTQAIFAGDSFTYGVGLPEEGTWAYLVSEKFKFDSVNLGFAGASIFGIVTDLMHYFKVYGNPEYLFCMFPDLERMQVFLNDNIMISKNNADSGFGILHMSQASDYSNRPKYAKKPFIAEDVMSNEIAYYYSLKAIQMLEQYCQAAGITFMWGIFHAPDANAIIKLSNNEFGYYSNFLDTGQHLWSKDDMAEDVFYFNGEYDKLNSCHTEEQARYGKRFFIAGDIELGRDRAHHGIHRHIHTAEAFIERVQKLNEDSRNK